jgi:malate dehydrogenase (oxaloacetate-decarboxylating)(NADP+)
MLRIGGAEALGPILMGLSKPVHVLQRGSTVEEIIDVAALAVVDAQRNVNHPNLRLSKSPAA